MLIISPPPGGINLTGAFDVNVQMLNGYSWVLLAGWLNTHAFCTCWDSGGGRGGSRAVKWQGGCTYRNKRLAAAFPVYVPVRSKRLVCGQPIPEGPPPMIGSGGQSVFQNIANFNVTLERFSCLRGQLAAAGLLFAGCLDTRHAGIGLALHHAVVACVAGFAGPVFVGALVQRTGSFGAVSAVSQSAATLG
jgi:hypothetical protein